jgi:GNAT superfamily N-acetyltransferase
MQEKVQEYTFQQIDETNRAQANAFISKHWLSTIMIIRGKEIDMTAVDGILVLDNTDVIGLITYILHNSNCEITSLDSLIENHGIATALINRVTETTKRHSCKKLLVLTTNDNTHALRFYQKRGFDIVRFHRNALARSRELKPEIPLRGVDNIPLRH